MKTYKSQTICIHARLRKFLDITIHHPLRYHHVLILGHRHAQQWQNIQMMKVPPCYNLPAEALPNVASQYI